MEADLRRAAPVSGEQMDSPAKVQAFDMAVVQQQCLAGTPDPIVSILSPVITLGLNGSFSSEGSFQVTNPLSGLGGNATFGQEQSISAPITFARLSELPDIYFSREVAAVSGADRSIALPLEQGASSRRLWLESHIESLEDGYSAALCPR